MLLSEIGQCSSVVERRLHKAEVGGSNPPTGIFLNLFNRTRIYYIKYRFSFLFIFVKRYDILSLCLISNAFVK